MGSILTFQGRIYLIDAGPGILNSLMALGISINEIDGVFHTHCHDDHFAGLTSLMLADHRINHYATPLVRASIIHKLSALMSLEEERFTDFFNICDLAFDEWNHIGGLEVLPVFSAHPVETSFMYFRTPWAGGYKTYGHLADIISLDVLEGMVFKDGVSREWIDKFRKNLFIPVDVKKIDAGKGSIHGNTVDFAADESRKIIMSHSSTGFSLKEKEIGSTTAFGQVDVLIPSRQDFSMKTAATLLRSYFPKVETDLVRLFLDCPKREYSPGSIILRKGMPSQNVYLLLSGVVEAIDSDRSISHMMSQGFLIGDISCFESGGPSFTYRALSPIQALEIPCILFIAFTREFNVFDELKALHLKRLFLLRTGLLGEMLSFPIQNHIARLMKEERYSRGTDLAGVAEEDILILAQGSAELRIDEISLGMLYPQEDFLGAEGVLFKINPFYTAITKEDTVCYRIAGNNLKDIPIIQLKLLENFKKRIGIFSFQFTLNWENHYKGGREETDNRRRELFQRAKSVSAALRGSGDRQALAKNWKSLTESFRDYLASGKDRNKASCEQKKILEKLDFWNSRLPDDTREIDSDFLEYIAAWIAARLIREK
jgi:hemerythrin